MCERLGTAEQEKELKKVIRENKADKSLLIDTLQKAQKIYGYLPEIVMQEIAHGMDIAESEVYGVASFYNQFSFAPRAKYVIDICMGTACFVLGANVILDKLCATLGIRVGEMSADGKWLITSVRCLGCCGVAPVLTINGEVYSGVKVQDVDTILKKYN